MINDFVLNYSNPLIELIVSSILSDIPVTPACQPLKGNTKNEVVLSLVPELRFLNEWFSYI